MNQLVLCNNGQEFVFNFSGARVGISMVLQLFLNSLRSWLFWFTVVTAIMILVLFITRGFRTSINSLTINDNTLSIRWYNRLRIRRINVNKIEEIATDKKCINITLKNDRVIRIPVNFLELMERRGARDFLKETTGF